MFFVISDIHGNDECLSEALSIYDSGEYEGIIICGDILFNGSFFFRKKSNTRNNCVELLNKYSNQIIAVSGNCDSENDLSELNFDVKEEVLIEFNDRKILLSHGHIYNEARLPHIGDGDIYLSGHLHIPRAELGYGIYILNPGSITSPRGGFERSYGVLSKEGFKAINFDGQIIKEVSFK